MEVEKKENKLSVQFKEVFGLPYLTCMRFFNQYISIAQSNFSFSTYIAYILYSSIDDRYL